MSFKALHMGIIYYFFRGLKQCHEIFPFGSILKVSEFIYEFVFVCNMKLSFWNEK